MSRPRPRRTSAWQRLLDHVLRVLPAPPRRPAETWVDDHESRPRPDLLQSLGGRAE